MNKSIFGVVGFVLGAAAGSLVTWKLIEKKYMDMADEEIQSVKEMYARKSAEPNVIEFTKPVTVIAEYKVDKFDEEKLTNLIGGYRTDGDKPDYTAYSNAKNATKAEKFMGETDIPSEKPYVISPEEFDELGYTICELTYYAGNDVLVDDEGDPIEDPGRTVGTEFSSHFGEYEDDAVFVRNDRLMSDYQILLDPGAY